MSSWRQWYEFAVFRLADVVVQFGNQNFDTPTSMSLDDMLFDHQVNDAEVPFLLDVRRQIPKALTDNSKSLIYRGNNLAHNGANALGVSIRWRSA